MISLMGKPSEAMFSHAAGWTAVIKSIAEREFDGKIDIVTNGNAIHQYNTIVINNGINYKVNQWNYFGGMTDQNLVMLENLSQYRGDCYTYNEEIEWESLFKRKELRDNNNINIEDMPRVELRQTKYASDKLIVGDSHSVSIYRPGHAISRNDGATLFGSLREDGLLRTFDFNGYRDITLYFGNIDIRFHIGRQSSPSDALQALCMRYADFANRLTRVGELGSRSVTIQGLIPVEETSRKLPGTGLHYGEPFYGSRQNRQTWVDIFNNEMEYRAEFGRFLFRRWENLPSEGFEESTKFKCMEARQSVHLRPEYYMFKDELYGKAEEKLF